jgi:hypothetical protein
MSNFETVHHRLFGPGLAFGQRELGVGAVLDVWFVSDGRIRTILADRAYWTEPQSEPLEYSKKKLRTAHSLWKKMHARPKDGDSSLLLKTRAKMIEPCPQNEQETSEDSEEEFVSVAAD